MFENRKTVKIQNTNWLVLQFDCWVTAQWLAACQNMTDTPRASQSDRSQCWADSAVTTYCGSPTGQARQGRAGVTVNVKYFPRNTRWHWTPPHSGVPGGGCNTCSGKIRIKATTQLPFFEHRRLCLDEWCKSQPTVEWLSTSVLAQCFFPEVKTSNCSCPTSHGEGAAC